jgi:putative oxidoreductase
MRIASVIARYLAGVIFLVMGLNGFLHFIPLPPPGALLDSSWVPFMSRTTCG